MVASSFLALIGLTASLVAGKHTSKHTTKHHRPSYITSTITSAISSKIQDRAATETSESELSFITSTITSKIQALPSTSKPDNAGVLTVTDTELVSTATATVFHTDTTLSTSFKSSVHKTTKAKRQLLIPSASPSKSRLSRPPPNRPTVAPERRNDPANKQTGKTGSWCHQSQAMGAMVPVVQYTAEVNYTLPAPELCGRLWDKLNVHQAWCGVPIRPVDCRARETNSQGVMANGQTWYIARWTFMIGVFCNPEMVAEAINTATNSMVSIQCVDTDADTVNGGTSTLLVTKSKRQAYSYTPQPSLAFTSDPQVTIEPTPKSTVSGDVDTTVSITGTVHPVVIVPPSSLTATPNYTKTVTETVHEIAIEPSSTLTVTAMITNEPSSSAPDKIMTETESYDMLNPLHLTFPPQTTDAPKYPGSIVLRQSKDKRPWSPQDPPRAPNSTCMVWRVWSELFQPPGWDYIVHIKTNVSNVDAGINEETCTEMKMALENLEDTCTLSRPDNCTVSLVDGLARIDWRFRTPDACPRKYVENSITNTVPFGQAELRHQCLDAPDLPQGNTTVPSSTRSIANRQAASTTTTASATSTETNPTWHPPTGNNTCVVRHVKSNSTLGPDLGLEYDIHIQVDEDPGIMGQNGACDELEIVLNDLGDDCFIDLHTFSCTVHRDLDPYYIHIYHIHWNFHLPDACPRKYVENAIGNVVWKHVNMKGQCKDGPPLLPMSSASSTSPGSSTTSTSSHSFSIFSLKPTPTSSTPTSSSTTSTSSHSFSMFSLKPTSTSS